MKAAVFSDTHTNIALCLEAVRRCRPDVIIHLGDHDRDAAAIHEAFPEIPLCSVCGNCDIAPIAPARDTVQLGPVKALICHGHTLGADSYDMSPLVYAAQEVGAKIAMYGHTHRAVYEEMGGVQLLNPGTAGKGRKLTWALVTVFDNGGIICEIKDL